jgi:polar amino acid transport system substrate-binding protein
MVLLTTGAQAADITFTTESYPPYTYAAEDGSIEGAGADQLRAIMTGVGPGVDYRIEIMPWARAFATAETQPASCVFAAARTPDRETSFQWVVPMLMDVNLIVARQSSPITATTIAEALPYSIGTQREDYTEALLRRAGFERLDLSASFDLTLAKLLGGRIELMAMSQNVHDRLVREHVPIRRIVVLSRQQLGIACNPALPAALIARMQSSLDRLRASGEQDRIQQRYGLPPVR